ncbi:phytanoyl-CoA dioxygenase family protein [Amycolatopsis silviterrae]|uniref:Phytanoyl-CoA dioxygenase family protein n=1 Tax=Amycolatopsis silviterrae TaxID=1656914 RepID=A0ABW5H7E8_9PSEU
MGKPHFASAVSEGIQNLDQYGYTVHENFLPTAEVQTLRSRLVEQAEQECEAGVATLANGGHAAGKYVGRPKSGTVPTFQSVDFLPNKGRPFLDLLHKPVIHEYAAHLFRGEPYNLASEAGVILRRGGTAQVLHADQQAIPLVLDRPVMFVMMVCLSDFTPDMGATEVVPGSHRFPAPDLQRSPEEQVAERDAEFMPITAPAGSVALWESRTWHRQGTSTSDQDRISIGCAWALHFIKPQTFFPAVVHDDVYDTLSDEDKRVLGFEVVREYAGAIGPRYRGDRRANLNVSYPYIPELKPGARA